MRTSDSPGAAGQLIVTDEPRNGLSDSASAVTCVGGAKAAVESLAKPAASTHHVKPSVTKRTRAPRAPAACGRSMRSAYQPVAAPTTAPTSAHVRPLSP